MKLISARASRAPAPISTENRAAAILVPRSKSMMPSAGPRSQCACGVNVERRAACRGGALRRCRRRSCRPARSRAAGSAGPAARDCGAARASASSRSSCLIVLRRARGWPPGSPWCRAPDAWRAPTSSPAAFCSRFRPSTSGSSRRRRVSSAASASSSASRVSAALLQRRTRTASRLSRRQRRDPSTLADFTCDTMPIMAAAHSQGRLPRRRSRHAVPARHQGAAEGDAGPRRQAGHSVRRRGSRRIGRRQHRHRHRPRQERDRGSLRRATSSSKAFSSSAARRSSSKRSARSRS